MRYLILVLVVLGGAAIPVQVAANKRIEQAVRSPVLAAAIALFVGSIALGLVAATGWLGRGRVGGAAGTPWWVWVVSAMSIFTVVSIVALPRVGAAAVIAATVFGQLTAAAVLDQFGWLGVPQVRLNWWRIGGVVLLLAGTVMMQRK
jgi:transporter family-2 protein